MHYLLSKIGNGEPDKVVSHNSHLQKIKIFFSTAILLMIVIMVVGGMIIKKQDFFSKDIITELSQTASYLNYKVSFVKAENSNFVSLIVPDATKVENAKAKSIPVLLYHGIITEPDGSNVLLENFKEQMFLLKRAGWQTVGIADFYEFIKGEKNLPDKSFLLTFDDGRKDSYFPVDPILRALDYRAVMFVIIDRSLDDKKASSFHLSANELKDMLESGRWDIQAHTKDGHDFAAIDSQGNQGHFFSNKLWLEDNKRMETEAEFENRIYNDFVSTKNELKSQLGVKAIAFAYPFGDLGQNSINFPEAKDVVADKIKKVYPMSFFQVDASNRTANYPQTNKDHYLIKRISVEPQWSGLDLLKILESTQDKNLPYQVSSFSDNDWGRDWGGLNFGENSMTTKANASTTGSAVFLNGSWMWQNYDFSATVNFKKGRTFSLVALYYDENNYLSCDYGKGGVTIRQKIGGVENNIAEQNGNFGYLEGKDIKIGIAINGNQAKCFVSDQLIVGTNLVDSKLTNGGIGFRTWDPELNNSELLIKKIKVEKVAPTVGQKGKVPALIQEPIAS